MKYFIRISKILFLSGILISGAGCEREFIPDLPDEPEEIVVEGYIEAGAVSLPPYVILTRSLPFFAVIGSQQISNIFVHDAIVEISDGNTTVQLEEVCWDDFDEEIQELLLQILNQLGIIPDRLPPINFCVYLDTGFAMRGEIGGRYELRIDVEGKQLESVTTIPSHAAIDSLFFVKPAGQVPDSLRELRVFINDPPGQEDFYRYFTSVNFSRFLAPPQSVSDDKFFDGQRFEFPLAKAEEPVGDGEFNPYYGLYTLGDTIGIRWCNMDAPHFRFWNTLEFNAINQGPFSNYTIVETNIEGGLGIWGGYSASYYLIAVE